MGSHASAQKNISGGSGINSKNISGGSGLNSIKNKSGGNLNNGEEEGFIQNDFASPKNYHLQLMSPTNSKSREHTPVNKNSNQAINKPGYDQFRKHSIGEARDSRVFS